MLKVSVSVPKKEMLFGTIETWLIWKLTKGQVHATDYSNASRTMLFNINTLEWDDDILKELDIPKCMLPKAVPSSSIFGETSAEFFGCPIQRTVLLLLLHGDLTVKSHMHLKARYM